jgi:tricorn protease
MSKGYYRHPTVHGDRIVFVSEDDLWSVSIDSGRAVRLTANAGEVTSPHFSEDGKLLAFIGHEEGHSEVYVMPSDGGNEKRLTYLGARVKVVGWHKGKIIFYSNHGQPFRQDFWLYSIDPEGGAPEKLPYGLATGIGFGDKGVVLGRNTMDLATWKRYRGGTAGELWIDKDGSGEFCKLIEREGNYSHPMWIGDRIYFLSDMDGIGNLYSLKPDGTDLKKLSDQREYYVRNATTDGKNIVYHSGADLYVYNIEKKRERQVEIEYRSPFIQRNRKFVSPERYFHGGDVNIGGSRLLVEARGKVFNLGNWEGGVVQCGSRDGIRYRLPRWLNDGKRIITVSDEGGEEHLEVYEAHKNELLQKIESSQFGRITNMNVSPEKEADKILFTNHRNELYWMNIKEGKPLLIERNEYSSMRDAAWSPDGKWIAYSNHISRKVGIIKLYNLKKQKSYEITKPILEDVEPYFSPDGKYLYFISYRVFNPAYDTLHFDLGFPKGSLPYVITLAKESKHPTDKEPAALQAKKPDAEKSKDIKVKVELDGITERVVPLPVAESIYGGISATAERIFYLSYPIQGVLDADDPFDQQANATLKYFDLDKQKEETLLTGVSGYMISSDGSALVALIGKKLRVISTQTDPKSLSKDKKANRESGWVDLNRIRISIDPPKEWKQMYAEAWRLQRDYFWVEDMSGVDWKRVYKRYYKLLDRIASRNEFADLVWEMQGELGTSHAYEWGGDYKKRPVYPLGYLGADLSYDEKSKAYTIDHIVQGDCWDTKTPPPLKKPGLNIKEGMLLKAINGTTLSKTITPQQALVNLAKHEVQLTVADKNGKNERNITVKTIANEQRVRYREWVERNKQYVHKKSRGKIGYIHIPDMMGNGFAEFHRHFFAEHDKQGLIIDVRYNGGGHVSQLLLQKLARKTIGFDQSRWFGYEPYPDLSVDAPMVAVTNEFAGSDGDIFSHTFKLMKLGTLIGKRTWGGVIGISPRDFLVDNSMTTQPEFSFWFKDVGWSVENYGTDPDIEVDISPKDYAEGKDPQLDKALELVKKQMKSYKYLKPDLKSRPRLDLP